MGEQSFSYGSLYVKEVNPYLGYELYLFSKVSHAFWFGMKWFLQDVLNDVIFYGH